ncbi:DNA-binding transcriptional LysR family regulator [Pseudorhodoplanes sinuspersici]|nr:DNA-binding transcriptional LysR family regulator [Pseudorhodoplanes sinuspersici]
MSTAAHFLHVTQPAVTRAIRSLEDEVGTPLLERRPGGSFLTQDGLIFARRTQRFFQQLSAALAATIGADAQSDAVTRLSRKISDVHIRSLIAIWKSRSFRGAAKALDVAEPTLHRPARDLERLVKTPLYRRTLDGIGLSPAGSELARRFALSVVEIAVGFEELAAHQGSAQVKTTIGVLPLAPKRLLAIVAEELLRVHPKSRLVIQEGSYDELVVSLRSGASDLIFGALRAPPPFDDLCEENLFDDPYRIVCRRDHPIAQIPSPKTSDLRKYNWVFPTAALPRRAVLDTIIAEWRLSPRVQIETNSLGALIADLMVSDHLGLLPREYIDIDDRSDLAALNLRVPHAPRIVGLTTRLDWLPTSFQSDFLTVMRKQSAVQKSRPQ